jgi:hypothetical protein
LAPVLIALLIATLHVAAAGAQPSVDDQRTLRARLEERFDIVPLTSGVGLRPKSPLRDVRLIEINEGTILLNGAPVSGRELKERLGADADAVLHLSYLTPAARREALEPRRQPANEPVEAQPPLEAPSREEPTSSMRRPHHSGGDRVRIFGDVSVREDESVGGQVVAVLGSVRVDGEVRDQVVAVLGSVDLGPKAVVGNDVVSVGGRVRRAEGAQIRGSVTEISVADPNVHVNFEPLFGWRGFYLFDHFAGVPRLIGTGFRFLLLVMLASIALVVARPTVEASAQRVSDSPIQTTLVGLMAQMLLLPALILTIFVLAISIIWIPLLLLVPFALLVLVLLALVGFSGTVYAVGQWTRRRFGLGGAAPFVDVFLGVMVILLPVILGRVVALAGWPGTPLAILLLMLGFAVEFVAWSSGFGAVLTNGFARWQARRASRAQPPPMAS